MPGDTVQWNAMNRGKKLANAHRSHNSTTYVIPHNERDALSKLVTLSKTRIIRQFPVQEGNPWKVVARQLPLGELLKTNSVSPAQTAKYSPPTNSGILV